MSNTNPIQKHFVVLCNHLDVEKILPYLRSERMVTTEEYETLSNPIIPMKQKREKLLIMMPRKGSDFFKNFGNCLVWSEQTALAKHIGVDVAAVPPCPHSANLPDLGANLSDFKALSGLISPGTGNLPPGMAAPLPSLSPASTPVRGDPSFVRNPTPQENEYLRALREQQRPGPQVNQQATSGHSVPHYAQGSQPAPSRPAAHSSVAPPTSQPQPSNQGQEWNDGPPKVFILYHKDPRLEQTHGIKANSFMDKVTDMAHILHSVGGFELTIDLFEKGDIDHLMTWITRKVNESRYVVLLLSPGLSEALNDPKGKNQLEADRGSFFAKTVINLMGNSPGEFVPVFLSDCEDHSWIPTSLTAAPKYTLDVDALVDCIQVDSDDPTYYQRVQDAIQMQQFEQWGRLILHLRGQRHQQPPAPANPPIQIPTRHGYEAPHGSAQVSQATPRYSHPTEATPDIHPGVPVSSDRYISEGDFLRIAQTVSGNWKPLGMRLGLRYSELERLANTHLDAVAATMAMFGMWQRVRGEEATRRNLKTHLTVLGFGSIAEKIFAAD